MAASQHEVTQLLKRWREGDKAALDKLAPLVYDELHRLAHKYISHERPNHTLQTTALVHEAYVRLVESKDIDWANRVHFFAVSAKIMRRILVDYARQSHSAKRGGEAQRVTLDEQALVTTERATELVALDDAMQGLAEVHPRRCEVVELRYFAGLNNQEIAEVLNVSEATVERNWRFARAWLYRQLH